MHLKHNNKKKSCIILANITKISPKLTLFCRWRRNSAITSHGSTTLWGKATPCNSTHNYKYIEKIFWYIACACFRIVRIKRQLYTFCSSFFILFGIITYRRAPFTKTYESMLCFFSLNV